MIRRLTIDFTILALSFFGTWFLLSEIRFIKEEKHLKITVSQEEKIGRALMKLYTGNYEIIEHDDLEYGINLITNYLKDVLDSSPYNYQVMVVKNPEINAYSLPGGFIILNSELINFCETPGELAGVIAHEMGHNENHDVLKRLAKNVGVNLTIKAIFGGENNKIKQLLNQAVSTRFDRTQEEKADAFAVEHMIKCNINPEHLAVFFERLLAQKPEIANNLDFLMTHPADDKRVEAIRNLSAGKKIDENPLDIKWQEIKDQLN